MAPPSQKQSNPSAGIVLPLVSILGTLAALIFHAGAAKLSYDKHGSIGWAFLAFLFGSLYYPYYAFFVSGSAPMMGGKRLRLF